MSNDVVLSASEDALRKRLFQELHGAGLFRPQPLFILVKLAALGLACAALIGLAYHTAWPSRGLLLLVLTPLLVSLIIIGHEGLHNAAFSSVRLNRALLLFTFSLVGGISSFYWLLKHKRMHHRLPNTPGEDPDMAVWPFAFCASDYRRAHPVVRVFQRRIQRYVFWPALTLFLFNMRVAGLRYLPRFLRESRMWRDAGLDLAALIGHYLLWIAVPILCHMRPLDVVLTYTGLWMLCGVYSAPLFLMAHCGRPCFSGTQHVWLRQILATRNLRASPIFSWMLMGLDYQIEHHLFPSLPHANLPRASRIVQAFCAAHQLPYQRPKVLAALREVDSHLASAWAAREIRLRVNITSASRVA